VDIARRTKNFGARESVSQEPAEADLKLTEAEAVVKIFLAAVYI